MRDGHPIARMLAIGVVASLIGIGLAFLIDWFPHQASTQAREIDKLWDVLLAVSVPVFVLVMSVAIYSVMRFRARPGDQRDGEPIHGSTKLEIIWVAIPFVIVTALAIYGWIVLEDLEEPRPNTMVVDVRGQQFAWNFRYEGTEGKPVRSNQLVLPVDRPVEFRIRASDVIHSFWVPDFRMKQDAVPGITTRTRVTPTRIGTYDVVCAELCGLGHSTMRQTVRVVDQSQFAAWLENGGRGGVPAVAPGLGAAGDPAGGGG